MEVVHLIKEDQKLFAMVAGGDLIEVNQDTFNILQVQLQDFFRTQNKKPK